MTRRTFALILIASAALCGHARASLYEFTLRGQITYSLLGTDPKVGDPFIVVYSADSHDLNPDPRIGRYAATGASLQLPLMTYPSLGSGNLEVLSVANNFSRLDYECAIQHPQEPHGWFLDIALAFPEGTFQTDALPLSLPMSEALVRRFAVFPLVTELFRGEITSYSSVEIPEPAVAGAILLFAVLAHSRR